MLTTGESWPVSPARRTRFHQLSSLGSNVKARHVSPVARITFCEGIGLLQSEIDTSQRSNVRVAFNLNVCIKYLSSGRALRGPRNKPKCWYHSRLSPYFKFLRNWLGVCPVTLRKVRLNELLLE